MANEYDVDRVGIDIEVDEHNSSEKISKLDSALEKLQQTLSKGWDFSNIEKIGGVFENVNTSIDKTSQKVKKAAETISDVELPKLDWQDTVSDKFDKTADSMKKVASGASEVEAETKKAAVNLEYLTSGAAKFDYIAIQLEKAKTQLQQLASAGEGYENPVVQKLLKQIPQLEKELNKITLDNIKSASKSVGEASVNLMDFASSAQKAKAAVEPLSKSTQKLSIHSQKAHKSLSGLPKLFQRIKDSIQFFLIYRVLSSVFQTITKSIQEGTANLYQYSKAIDGTFANSLDRLTTSFLYLKNAIGAAVAPIINALTPAIERALDLAAELANRLAEIFASLAGAKTFKKAIKYHQDYAEAVEKSANANKKALASFDEINNITSNIGGSQTKTISDPSQMFETAEVGTGIDVNSEEYQQLSMVFDNLRNSWENLKGTIAGLKSALGPLWDAFSPFVDFAWDTLNAAWSKFNDILAAFGKWCEEHPEIVRNIANVISDFFFGFLIYLGVKKIGNLLSGFVEKLKKFIETADEAKVASKLLAVAGFAVLVEEIMRLREVWGDMTKMEKVVSVLGLVAIAAAATAAAVGALQSAWSLGIAAAAIVAGVIAIEASISSAQKRVKKNAKDANIKGYADGGFVGSGQMFIAREAGPEMVGSIGGRTAVANNDQIVQAVSLGVYNAVVDAMSKTSGSGQQPITVQINGREVFKAVQDESYSFKQRTGQPAF